MKENSLLNTAKKIEITYYMYSKKIEIVAKREKVSTILFTVHNLHIRTNKRDQLAHAALRFGLVV